MHLSFNTGMAFSRGQSWGPLIGVLALFVIVGLLLSLRRQPGRLTDVSVGLIVGERSATCSTVCSVSRLVFAGRWSTSSTSSGSRSSMSPTWPSRSGSAAGVGFLAGRSAARIRAGRRRRRGRAVIVELVPPALAGERLDRIVALMLDISRSVAVAVIEAGGVSVDGAAATTGKVRLAEGQEVGADPSGDPGRSSARADPTVVFDVLHEDDHIIVVDKPAGLVVHPGAGNPDHTLVERTAGAVSGALRGRRADPSGNRAPSRRR